jgi:hypothetical protein
MIIVLWCKMNPSPSYLGYFPLKREES